MQSLSGETPLTIEDKREYMGKGRFGGGGGGGGGGGWWGGGGGGWGGVWGGSAKLKWEK